MRAAVDVNRADGMNVFVQHDNFSRSLHDLKWKRHIGESWDARQVALRLRIGGGAALEVLPFLLGGPRLVGNLVAFDDTLAGRHAFLRAMVLNVPGGRVRDLPEAGQIRRSGSRPRQRDA